MPRKWIIAGLVGLLLICATIGASLLAVAGSQLHGISVSLLGYTNDPSGIPCGRFVSTNAATQATQRFAVFRLQNPTRCDLFCYFSGVILNHSDGSHSNPIQFQSPQFGDFDLRPRGFAVVAVPEPAISGRWELVFSLCHRHNYRHPWQFRLAMVASRMGLDWHDKKSWSAFSTQITK